MRAFVLATVLFGLPAQAETYAAISDKQAFLQLISGRSLHIPMFSLKLDVLSDGTIKGSALGWAVSGTWNWNEGYFCREMDWSGTPIPVSYTHLDVYKRQASTAWHHDAHHRANRKPRTRAAQIGRIHARD